MPNVPVLVNNRLEALPPVIKPFVLEKLPPSVKVLAPIDRLPDVRVMALATVVAAPKVIPPPLIVKLFTLPVNKPVGNVKAPALVKATVAAALLASIAPDVLVGTLPAMVKVLAPIVSVPDVAANVPVTIKSLDIITPPALFIIKLVNVPPNNPVGKVIDEAFVNATVELALVASIVPVDLVGLLPDIVNVFAPTVSVPLFKAKVPLTVVLTFKFKLPKVLLQVRLL